MKIQKIFFTLACLFLVVFLIFVNIGLNISGPAHSNEIAIQSVQEKVHRKFSKINTLNRHSFKYITYSSVVKDKAYFFDKDGELIVEKKYDETQLDKVRQIAATYGIENPEITLGYGYINPVYVIEQDHCFLYLDYDSLENVFYMKGE